MEVYTIMKSSLLFLIALIPLLILVAPLTNVFAISTNQTSSNSNETTTNNLLKQLIKIENTTQGLQQDNANVLATKLDIIKAELERIQTKLSTSPIPPNEYSPFSLFS